MAKNNILHKLHNHTKEELFSTGVYTITSKVNGKMYVGSVSYIGNKYIKSHYGFYGRWNLHLNHLKRGVHHSIYLQRHVNKYGIEDLKFEILDICDPSICKGIEIYWINTLDTCRNGFNMYVYFKDYFSKIERTNRIKLNEEDVINKYKELLDVKKTSIYFKVSYSKIREILYKHEITLNSQFYSKNKLNYKLLIEEYFNNKISASELAKKYKVDSATLLSGFRRLGYDTKINIVRKNIEYIYKRHIDGEMIKDLANEYKIDKTSLMTCFREYKKNDLDTPLKKYEKVEKDIFLIYKRYCNGESINKQISIEYLVPPSTIYRVFKKKNLKIC
jgi:hypothetical protein